MTRVSTARLLALLGCQLLATSCVTGTLARERTFTAPVAGSVEALRVGEDDLDACLERLGAPLIVREDRDRAVLVWGWRETRGWSVRASISIVRGASTNFSFAKDQADLEAVVGVFDPSWRLVLLRRGRLGELTQRWLPRVPGAPVVRDPLAQAP